LSIAVKYGLSSTSETEESTGKRVGDSRCFHSIDDEMN
jgi:hypothetical protein